MRLRLRLRLWCLGGLGVCPEGCREGCRGLVRCLEVGVCQGREVDLRLGLGLGLVRVTVLALRRVILHMPSTQPQRPCELPRSKIEGSRSKVLGKWSNTLLHCASTLCHATFPFPFICYFILLLLSNTLLPFTIDAPLRALVTTLLTAQHKKDSFRVFLFLFILSTRFSNSQQAVRQSGSNATFTSDFQRYHQTVRPRLQCVLGYV